VENPFANPNLAAGYATARPAVHPRILARLQARLRRGITFRRALDVGCGAGLSTLALDGFAEYSIGIDPAELMLRWAKSTAPGAEFVAAGAEALPLRDGSINIITAAGSLNYVRLPIFFGEAERVLAPGGLLVVYDFLPGSTLRDSADLDHWFAGFVSRYPWPAGQAAEITPESLAKAAGGFRLRAQERFEIGLCLSPEFYVNYMMTETNVDFAIRNGAPAIEIRQWCSDTLGPIFDGQNREVLFRGYFACFEIA
jgi:SAM-dependent methyltransferase